MATPSYQVTCTRKDKLAESIYEFTLTNPEGFAFEAGQFVLFDFPLIENPDDIQTRAFSIASTPEEEEILIVAKILEGGRASRWIEEKLEVGVNMRMQGPFGLFLLDKNTDNDNLFVCTGSGIAPFRSQIIQALKRGDKRRMDLVFGVYSQAHLFWVKEMEKLANNHENFFFHPVLSDPEGEWDGETGWVQDALPEIIPDLSSKSIYLCGNPNMVKDVKKLCLEEWGVPKESVHGEGYI